MPTSGSGGLYVLLQGMSPSLAGGGCLLILVWTGACHQAPCPPCDRCAVR